jgi:hypothetical protein
MRFTKVMSEKFIVARYQNLLEHIRTSHHHYHNFLTFIFLRATALSYDVPHRTVRSWRQNSFGCFSRWPWNKLRNYMFGVACCRKEWGKRYTMRWMERGLWGGGVGKQWTEKESFQQYLYNRYKIVVYTGLRSDSIKNHASRYKASMTLKSKGMLNTLNI